jgi:L-ascorbate metabolism protein UlaG (beta-lactamase superfamily)
MPSEALWRRITDWAKHRPFAIGVAHRLSMGKGRFRFVDRIRRVRPCAKPDLSGWNQQTTATCWLGHATMLIRIAGLNVLTDPVFSRRIGLGLGVATLGPGRQVAPALSISQLPPIDLILISHAHMDHLDRPSLWQLAGRFPKARLVHFDGLDDLLSDLKFSSRTALSDGESTRVGTLDIRAIKTKHWGARLLADKHRGFGSFLLKSSSRTILFGGDSAMGTHWDSLKAESVDLAIMGIGAYDPWIEAHATPEQAYDMAKAMRARAMQPMHHSTFVLSREPTDEPMRRLMRYANGEVEIVATGMGESHLFNHAKVSMG